MTSLRRRQIRLIERAGFHGLLAKSATSRAKEATQEDVELFYDDIWIRRVGDKFYGDRARFDYRPADFAGWKEQHVTWAKQSADCWFHDYAPQAGDTIVDIGAGFGNDAILFSRAVGPAGAVVAVEAHPALYRRLVKTCKWSKLHNVIPVDLAADSARGSKWVEGVKHADEPGEKAVVESAETATERFDEIAALLRLERVSFLKMNVAGGELAALEGMPETLKKTARIAVACHDFRADYGQSDFFRTRKKVSAILRDAGFHLKRRVNDPRPYVADTLYGAREGA